MALSSAPSSTRPCYQLFTGCKQRTCWKPLAHIFTVVSKKGQHSLNWPILRKIWCWDELSALHLIIDCILHILVPNLLQPSCSKVNMSFMSFSFTYKKILLCLFLCYEYLLKIRKFIIAFVFKETPHQKNISNLLSTICN